MFVRRWAGETERMFSDEYVAMRQYSSISAVYGHVHQPVPVNIYTWQAMIWHDIICRSVDTRGPRNSGLDIGVAAPTPLGRQGRIYSQRGPVQKKMWGPSLIFPQKNWRPFFAHHSRSLGGVAHYFGISAMQKNSPLLLCGPPFYRGPCSAENAEHA